MKRQKIKIELIETNEGQILGVPKNPRCIKGEEFEKLKQSIKDFPEMLEIREVVVFPLNGRFIALGGNMRFLGCKDLGYKEIDCVILPKDMPVEKLKEFAIKDNGNFGAWDFDMLANEWDLELLDMANIKIPNFTNGHEANDMNENELDLTEEFDPYGKASGMQRVVFLFDDEQNAESFLKKIDVKYVKRNMAWQVDLSSVYGK